MSADRLAIRRRAAELLDELPAPQLEGPAWERHGLRHVADALLVACIAAVRGNGTNGFNLRSDVWLELQAEVGMPVPAWLVGRSLAEVRALLLGEARRS